MLWETSNFFFSHNVFYSVRSDVMSTSGFFIGPHVRREYWCSSQEAESREISIRGKNLFLNRCKINMFKLKLNKKIISPFVSIYDNIALFAAESEEPKIGM